MDYVVGIHLKQPTEANPTMAVAVYHVGGFGPWHRTLRHRGVDTMPVLLRPMTPEETEVEKKTWRMYSSAYRTWEGLIKDEYHITRDIEWVKQIYALSGLTQPLYDLINFNQSNQFQ